MRNANVVKLAVVGAVVSIGCTSGVGPSYLSGFSDSPEVGGGMAIGTSGGSGPVGPQPSFGATNTTLAKSPPPISGGTLLALQDGMHVVAADSDRDSVYVVDVAAKSVTTIALTPNDEPGRIVEDSLGQVHVVLRSAGAVATIDLATATIVARRNVCISPRGIAFDSANARLVVACETGEIVTMSPAIGGAPQVLTTLASGLRDVVVRQPRETAPSAAAIYVSRFRTAEVMKLAMDGTLISTTRPEGPSSFGGNGADATLAWRMIAAPARAASQEPLVAHEFATLSTVSTSPGGYGGGGGGGGEDSPGPEATSCSASSIVTPAVTQRGAAPTMAPTTIVLPVDFVVTENGYAVISAGNGHTAALPGLTIIAPNAPCANLIDGSFDESYSELGQPTAIALMPDGTLVVQSREPAMLTVLAPVADVSNGLHYSPGLRPISLATDSVEDTGHAIFHSNSGIGVACASCHGEAADDGHIWTFDTVGARRTPSLRGTISGTAPYHWDGAMKDIGTLADQVMTGRMSGPQLTDGQKSALQSWLFAIPAPPLEAPLDAATVARGKALFENPSIGCAGCHAGPQFTNNATVDVGTGGAFQVPPLVGVRARAPYLHNGCAKTLQDRFGACATPQHGNISQLQQSDIDALIAYLESI